MRSSTRRSPRRSKSLQSFIKEWRRRKSRRRIHDTRSRIFSSSPTATYASFGKHQSFRVRIFWLLIAEYAENTADDCASR